MLRATKDAGGVCVIYTMHLYLCNVYQILYNKE